MTSVITIEEKKWLKSLKHCMDKKPKSVEILVQEKFNGNQGCCSEIHLMKKGITNKSMTEIDDLMHYNPFDYSIDYIIVDDVAANNHGY